MKFGCLEEDKLAISFHMLLYQNKDIHPQRMI